MKSLRSSILALGFALLSSACGTGGVGQDTTSTSSTGAPQAEHEVALYSWWIAPGEAEALQALIDTYKTEFPRARVTNNGAASGNDAKANLDKEIDSTPPDLFQYNAYYVADFMKAHPGAVKPLDEFFAEPTLHDAVLPDVLGNVTLEGHVYAMPVGLHRENALFYSKQIFAAQKLAPPTTLSEFLDACQKLKAAGIVPVAMGGQGWIMQKMFTQILQGTMGAALFRDFITRVKSPTDPDVKAAFMSAIDVFGTVMTTYVDADQIKNDKVGWTDAAEAVHDGKAAMYLHGDWVKGYFVQLGWSPGVDFGQIGGPGSADLFWYGVDVFGLPEHAPHPTDAHDFLAVVASKEGQVAFNRLKGSTPMRTDVRADLDPLGQATLDDLVNAKVRVPVFNRGEWDDACLQFSKDGDKEALYQAFVVHKP